MAGKLLATIVALLIAAMVAGGVIYLSDLFRDLVVGNVFGGVPASDLYKPAFLGRTVRLDAICAICLLLIPISIALWWPTPISVSQRIAACCFGVAAGSIPVVVQILSWPFLYHSTDAVWAVALVALFATVTLSIFFTRRHLMAAQNSFGEPVVPIHARRGITRLYLVVLVPWVIWFGYVAYKAHTSIDFQSRQRAHYFTLKDRLENLRERAPSRDNNDMFSYVFTERYIVSELATMRDIWDARTNDEIPENLNKASDENRERLNTAIYALLAMVALPLLYPVFLWVLAGFRKSKSAEEASSP